MKLIVCLIFFVSIVFNIKSQNLINVNSDPNGDPWWVGGFREISEKEASEIPELVLQENNYRAALPSRLNNALQPYFRQIILQQDGSCSQTSGIAYVFTYEVNFLRGLNSKDSANQYPSHFTYNFLNGGSGKNGSNYTDGWQILKENGVPGVFDYGGLFPIGDTGWMSGYQKYINGMNNRIADYYKINIGTPEGLLILKRWLFDHGNGSPAGGLACFSAGIATAMNRPIPTGQYEAKRRIIVKWSDPVDHAMTFIGWDDSVRYDFNGDKKYTNNIDITGDSVVDMRDWEIGAMIFANSWGLTWGDTGFAYCPYRNLALKVSEGGISSGRAYVIIPEVSHPVDMIAKIKLYHSQRDKISIRVGVSEYMYDSVPQYEIGFSEFNKKGGPKPVQGINHDPVEISLDISPLLHQKIAEPGKFFLVINESDNDSVAGGILYRWSIEDMRDGGKEYFSTDSMLTLKDNSTTYSSIFLTRIGFPPYNLQAMLNQESCSLIWHSPEVKTGLLRYVIIKDGKQFAETNDTFFTDFSAPNGTVYKVKALYPSGLSLPSNTITIENNFHMPVAASGYSLRFDGMNDCINCGDSIDLANHDFTIEFWTKRNPDPSDQFVIGGGKWNTSEKGLHIGFRNNKLMCGFWGDDVHTDDVYTDTFWHHWAVTFDTTNKMQKIYRDGNLAGDRKAKANFQGKGNLYLGCMKGDTWFFEGEMDEVRIWNYVRSNEQLDSFRYLPLVGNEAGLLGYWRFDERSGNILSDLSGKNSPGQMSGFDFMPWQVSSAWANRYIHSADEQVMSFAGYSKYGHPVKFNLIEQPNFGVLAVDTSSMKINYIPSYWFSGTDSFRYEVQDNSLSSEYIIYIKAGYPESVSEAVKGNIKILSNPVSEFAVIIPENELQNAIVEIFGLNGQKVFEKRFENPGNELLIATSHLQDGIYILKISTGNEIYFAKLVVAN